MSSDLDLQKSILNYVISSHKVPLDVTGILCYLMFICEN